MNVHPPKVTAQYADALKDPEFDPPIEVIRPQRQLVPFVFASPHSGTHYPDSFLNSSPLDLLELRRSEDSFVNTLFEGVKDLGAPLLHALFPRAYLDPNREPYELDPSMFHDNLPAYANTRSLRVAGGLGTVARVVTDGTEIYHSKMPFSEVERRIESLYLPYHRQLRHLLEETLSLFGYAILIDCHSMPSIGGPMDDDNGHGRADIVLGDRFGTSCAPSLTQLAETTLQDLGYVVDRNNPYAGGYTTDHYGRPIKKMHALQIEINRAMYMDEEKLVPHAGMEKAQLDMLRFAETLMTINAKSLRSWF